MKVLTRFPLDQVHEVYDVLTSVVKASSHDRDEFIEDINTGKGSAIAYMNNSVPVKIILSEDRWVASLYDAGDVNRTVKQKLAALNERLDVAYRKFN